MIGGHETMQQFFRKFSWVYCSYIVLSKKKKVNNIHLSQKSELGSRLLGAKNDILTIVQQEN